MSNAIIDQMGYLFILGYVLLVGVGTFLMKSSLKELTAYQLNFLMGIGMLITGVPALWIAQKSLKVPASEAPLGFIIGVMMAVGSIFFVLAFEKLPAGLVTVLSSAYVVLVVVLSIIFLKEGLDAYKFLGILLTLVGVAILGYKG